MHIDVVLLHVHIGSGFFALFILASLFLVATLCNKNVSREMPRRPRQPKQMSCRSHDTLDMGWNSDKRPCLVLNILARPEHV